MKMMSEHYCLGVEMAKTKSIYQDKNSNNL